MPNNTDCIDGKFYLFNARKKGNEIGRILPKEKARISISDGEDVYTKSERDAKKLASMSLTAGKVRRTHKKGKYPSFTIHPNQDCGSIYYGTPRLVDGEEEGESEGEE